MKNLQTIVGLVLVAGILVTTFLTPEWVSQAAATIGHQVSQPQPLVVGVTSVAGAVDEIGMQGRGRKQRGEPLAWGLVQETAAQTSQTVTDVLEALRNAQTLAQIAEAGGSDADAVIDAFATRSRDRLDQAVERGRLTTEKAEQMHADMLARATTLMNDATLGERLQTTPRPERARPSDAMEKTPGFGALVQATGEVTGLSVADIRVRLRDGETLSQIAEASGSDANTVIDAAVVKMQERQQRAITAGRLTQAEADTMIETFRNEAQELMNRTITAPSSYVRP